MEVYIYSDGIGGVFAYASLSDFLRSDKSSGLGVGERALRGVFSERDVYVDSLVANRWLRRCGVEKMVRRKVRPKYLFGKEY